MLGDLSSTEWILNLVYSSPPDEVYHLAAQSHVRVGFDVPEYTTDMPLRARHAFWRPFCREWVTKARFYQASSSERCLGRHPASPRRKHSISAAQLVRNRRNFIRIG